MANEACDIRLQDRDVAQRPVTMRRDRLPAFRGWLESRGWVFDGTIGDYEVVRAWRSKNGVGKSWIIVHDGPDAVNLLLFDMAAREAERFEMEVAPCKT